MIGLVLALSLGMPQLDIPQLPAITRDPQVTFLDRGGAVIGVRGGRYGPPVDVAKLPKYVPAAFVAIEDKRFYEHQGYDLQGIARALVTDLGEGRATQGASTITQQLARNLFLTSDRTLERKGTELIYAVELEQAYSKDQILGLYLSRVYFGSGAYGIEAAARALLRGLGRAPDDPRGGDAGGDHEVAHRVRPGHQPGRSAERTAAGAGRHGRDRRDHRRAAREGAGRRRRRSTSPRPTRPRSTSSTGWTSSSRRWGRRSST